MTKKEKEFLKAHLPAKDVEELSKLLKNYDVYIMKLKKQVQKLVDPLNLQVKSGLAFVDKPRKSEE